MDSYDTAQGQDWPSHYWNHDSNMVVLELEAGKNFQSPPSIIPEKYGIVFHVHDTDPAPVHNGARDIIVPGPYKFESRPLHSTIAKVDSVYIIPCTEAFRGAPAKARAAQQDIKVAVLEIWNEAFNGKRILLVRTLWHWFEPWKTTIQAHTKPGVRLIVLDEAGASRIVYRSRRKAK